MTSWPRIIMGIDITSDLDAGGRRCSRPYLLVPLRLIRYSAPGD